MLIHHFVGASDFIFYSAYGEGNGNILIKLNDKQEAGWNWFTHEETLFSQVSNRPRGKTDGLSY